MHDVEMMIVRMGIEEVGLLIASRNEWWSDRVR